MEWTMQQQGGGALHFHAKISSPADIDSAVQILQAMKSPSMFVPNLNTPAPPVPSDRVDSRLTPTGNASGKPQQGKVDHPV